MNLKEHNPLISVIMSVYNGEKYIKESIDSILQQTYKNFEFIIVDDRSDDNTEHILTSFTDTRVKLIKNSRRIGQAMSLNKAIIQSKGKYIARQDHDDISVINRLMNQVRFMEKNPKIGLLGSNGILINEQSDEIKGYDVPSDCLKIKWTLLFRNQFLHSSVMIRSSILQKFKLLYVDYKFSQDFDLWSKFASLSCLKNINENLIKIRKHTGSKSMKSDILKHEIPRGISFENINKILRIKKGNHNNLRAFIYPKEKNLSFNEVSRSYKIILQLYFKFFNNKKCECYENRDDVVKWIEAITKRRIYFYSRINIFSSIWILILYYKNFFYKKNT
tara:strand:- start:9065 stop:10063 length:999 start_codon:yes stop_codon:yes gene_type:complete